MQKQIKYRWLLWWLFIYWYYFKNHHSNQEWIYNIEWDRWVFYLNSESLWQFIWLLDKNWKEIYIWDIIKFQFPKYKDSQRIWDDEFIWVVWENKYYHSCVYVWDKEYHIDRAILWEIIWNIYQNEELLFN